MWNGTLNSYPSTAGFGSLTLTSTAARLASAPATAPGTDQQLSYGPSPGQRELSLTVAGSSTQLEVIDRVGKVYSKFQGGVP